MGADLANMQLLSNFDEGICFLLCVIDVFIKDTCVLSLKNKKLLQLLTLFRKFQVNLDETKFYKKIIEIMAKKMI